MNSAGTVQVAVRHILSDKVSGGVVRPRTRTVTWSDGVYQVQRPAEGRESVELDCPRCSASLLAEVRDASRTRLVRGVSLALAALCAVLFVCSLVYALHEGGRTLPEGASLPVLFPVSIGAAFVTFAAAPTLFLRGRLYNGVTLLDAPKPRRQHQLRPVRGKEGTGTRPTARRA
ncbi:hypothetical protein [Streptomyces sp. NPDC008150]|uniref:hypothetical protein n=1 Tax=Streptomyces sp. NPDC008150 TaxID=3364816 RepID=UPI0036EB3197